MIRLVHFISQSFYLKQCTDKGTLKIWIYTLTLLITFKLLSPSMLSTLLISVLASTALQIHVQRSTWNVDCVRFNPLIAMDDLLISVILCLKQLVQQEQG